MKTLRKTVSILPKCLPLVQALTADLVASISIVSLPDDAVGAQEATAWIRALILVTVASRRS